jgi:hypothetical protein
MAQHIAGGTVVSSSQSFVVVYHNIKKSQTTLNEHAENLRKIAREVLDDKSLVGGQADEVRKMFEDIAAAVDSLVSTAKTIEGPLDRATAAAATLEHGSKAASQREDNKKSMANVGVLKKE